MFQFSCRFAFLTAFRLSMFVRHWRVWHQYCNWCAVLGRLSW